MPSGKWHPAGFAESSRRDTGAASAQWHHNLCGAICFFAGLGCLARDVSSDIARMSQSACHRRPMTHTGVFWGAPHPCTGHVYKQSLVDTRCAVPFQYTERKDRGTEAPGTTARVSHSEG
jgi:hypothetical protein